MDVPRTRGDNPFTHSILPDRPQVPRRHGDEPFAEQELAALPAGPPRARGSTGHTLDAAARTGNDLSDKLSACRE